MSTDSTSSVSSFFNRHYNTGREGITATGKAFWHALPGTSKGLGVEGVALTAAQRDEFKSIARLATTQKVVAGGAGIFAAGGTNGFLKRMIAKKPNGVLAKLFSNSAARWTLSSLVGAGTTGAIHNAIGGKFSLAAFKELLGTVVKVVK